MKNESIFNRIAEALLIDYTSVYYVDAVTNEYQWYSYHPGFGSLQIRQDGKNFFDNMARTAEKVVYEEDKHIFLSDISREKVLSRMQKGMMQSFVYRLMIDGKPVWHTLRMIRGTQPEADYFILGILNIDKEMRMRQETEKLERERGIFNQIAESLALHYDMIYYVNSVTGSYAEFTSKNRQGNFELSEEGKDFFADAQRNMAILVHPKDQYKICEIIKKDYLVSALETTKMFRTVYRLMIDGKPRYTRLSVIWSSDRVHWVIGVENVDAEIRKAKEKERELRSANELARRDELTGVGNKNAYHELENEIQRSVECGAEELAFAIVVCDLNDLKKINDTKGHKAGDDYIRAGCKMICDVFAHSPVFRVGGDEFAVLLTQRDYFDRDVLTDRLRRQVLQNRESEKGPILAVGLATYRPETDGGVADVFERADSEMYENKKFLKGVTECFEQ